MKKQLKLVFVVVIAILTLATLAYAKSSRKKGGEAKGAVGKALPGETLDQTAIRMAKELAKGKNITIHVLVTWDAPGTALTKVIPEWEQATGVKIKSEPLSTLEMEQKVNLELSSGQPEYDIIQYDGYIRKPLLENPGVMNLDPFLEKYPFKFDGLVNTKAELWGVNDAGAHVAIPFYWCNFVYVYRKDLMGDPKEKAAFKKKYGYDYDPDNLTWDKSYKDLAEFFTRDTNGDGKIDFWGAAEMFAPYAAGDTFMARYLNYWDADKSYLSDPKTGKCTINDKYGVAVFRDLSNLIKKGHMIPEILQTDWASILGTFGSGRCAMAGQYAPTWMPLQSTSSEFPISGPGKVGFTALPGMKGKQRSSQDAGWLSFITKNSKNQELAYLFILWAGSDKIDKAMAMTTLHNPIRAATYKDSEVLKANPIFLAEFLHPKGFYTVPDHLIYNEEQLILSNVMQAVASGDLTPEKAVEKVCSEIEAKWKEIQ